MYCRPVSRFSVFCLLVVIHGKSNALPQTFTVSLVDVNLNRGVFVDLNLSDPRIGHVDMKHHTSFNVSGSQVSVSLDDVQHLCIRRRLGGDVIEVTSCKRRAWVHGVRVHGDRVSLSEDGLTTVPANTEIDVVLIGVHFTANAEIAFTTIGRPRGSRCDNLPIMKIVTLSQNNVLSQNVIEFKVSLPASLDDGHYYVCIKETGEVVNDWIHQGDDELLKIHAVGRLLPTWMQASIISFLLLLSGLFSGLNLGLMTLDSTELQVLENCGTDAEKKYAQIIYPLRTKSNYLLCSLLLGNVLVNSTLTILLDDLTSGMIAVVLSTISIVVFGEIIPQAICSRHGLAIGAKTVWVTKLFMLLTFPLSFPISKLLDYVLGEEIRNIYNRKRLMEFIRVTKDYNDLNNEEVDIISGALELTKKTVADVMTRIDDVFMVPLNAILNFNTVSEIMKRGYSRIPVYDDNRNNIVSLLNIKDLAFVDPDDNTPLKTLCEFYNHPLNYVFPEVTLDVMLNEFKKGRSHLAFVHRVNNEGHGDPFYEIVGIVTLEDVIEEIIQSEIIDETDVLTDNRRKQLRKEPQIKQDFSDFAKLGAEHRGKLSISPQLALATYQFLSTSVEPFKKECLSETVLKKLMTQNVYFKTDTSCSSSNSLYQNGKAADYFILILEGKCQVTMGRESLSFESGSFNYFGVPAITTPGETKSSNLSLSESTAKHFVPDYTVTPVGEALYMKVHRATYMSAYRATLMERKHRHDPDMFSSDLDHTSRSSSAELSESNTSDQKNEMEQITLITSE